MIRQRDLLLVPFPFSDQSGRKVRPVIAISNDNFNNYSDDVLVVGVTSNISKDKYTISLNPDDLEVGILLALCCVKAENILKIESDLIIKKIGVVKKAILKKIYEKLFEILKEN